MNLYAIKELSKKQLEGNVLMLFLAAFIVSLVTSAVSSVPVVGFILAYFVTPPLTLGTALIYVNLAINNQKPNLDLLFSKFDKTLNCFVLFSLISLYTSLWSLLFIVPGIIKGYSYSMAFYILAENTEMPANVALDESVRIMNGNKMDLFKLHLSFFLLYLLMLITFGLASFYVVPYNTLAFVNFYNIIKNDSAFHTQNNVF